MAKADNMHLVTPFPVTKELSGIGLARLTGGVEHREKGCISVPSVMHLFGLR
jgi:hypothetical protein